MDFDPILSCPSDFSDSVTNHIETSTIVKLQKPHSNCIIGKNTKLPLRVKKNKKNLGVEKHLHKERKQRVQSNKGTQLLCAARSKLPLMFVQHYECAMRIVWVTSSVLATISCVVIS